jgi:predicted transcriptional regulator
MPDTLEHSTAEPIRDYSRLTFDDQKILRAMRDAGKTQVEIAAVLGCSQSTVSKFLSTWTDTRDEARDILRHSASRLAKRIVNGRSEAVAVEVLDRIGVTERPAAASQGNKGQITVIIGAPDADVKIGIQVNGMANYQTQDPQLPCANEG